MVTKYERVQEIKVIDYSQRVQEIKVIDYSPSDVLEMLKVVVPEDGMASLSIDSHGGLTVTVTRDVTASYTF